MHANRSLLSKLAVLSFLVAVGAISVLGKTVGQAPATAIHADRLNAAFNEGGLVQLDSRPLSKDGVYALNRFVRPPCNGVLNVVALQRNAEGAGLLAQAVPTARVRFILDGTPYETFPTVQYWTARFGHAVGTAVGRQPAPPLLVAYSELGACALSAGLS